MKKKLLFGILTFFALCFLLPANPAAASSPTLSLTGTGDGDSVQINVTGSANSSVLFYYFKNGSSQLSYLGNTNASGVFSTTISTAAYNITPSSLVHVMVGGVSGAQSADMAWPYSSAGYLALDKTGLVLPIGQSAVITAYNSGTNLIYLSSNSNPIVANANINGNQITVTAENYGATMITICAQSNTASCASAYVNVQNTGSSPLAFGQNTVGLINGQSTAISIYGGTGTYLLSNNSNSNIISAGISGLTVNLTANASSGFAAITICSSDLSACGIINANIGSSNSTDLNFSQSSPTMSVGQNLTISLSGGGSSSYSILSNSNTTSVGAGITSSSLSLNALSSGSSTIIVCSSMGSCKSLTATVIGNSTNGGAMTLSQNNLWLLANQNISLTVSGGTAPYSILPGDNNIATSTINGSIITVTGVNAGSTSISVCSAAGGCANLSVLVNGASANTNANISLSPSQIYPNSTSTNAIVNILGNGSYFISNNSNAGVATAIISGSQVIVTPISSGSDTISVCQNGGECANLLISASIAAPAASISPSDTAADTGAASSAAAGLPAGIANNTLVRDPSGKIYFVSNNAKQRVASLAELRQNYAGQKIQDIAAAAANQIPTAVSVYKFTVNILYGASGQAVTELQKKLKNLNLYSGAIDGHYTVSLVTAVRKYQKNNGIKQTGNVGPATAASLNK